jgi:hypothetical protein
LDLIERPAIAGLRHPWETARLQHFQAVLHSAGFGGRDIRVLDMGAGDGWPAASLVPFFGNGAKILCVDLNYDADALASLAPGVEGAREVPSDGTYDLMMLLDVLEHVEHDTALLGTLVSNHLADDGRVLVSVPAWPHLFSTHDEALGHYRRYRPSEGLALIRDAGLEPEWTSGLFGSLLFIRGLQAVLERFRAPQTGQPHTLEWRAGAVSARLVDGILRLDAWVSRALARVGLRLPGLTWWALCRRAADG